jgi:ferrous iron transport protein A
MKKVSQMQLGEESIIVKITAPEAIKNRLFSMGVTKGNKIKLLDYTLQKETWEIDAEGTRVALRKEEADSIFVKG